LGKQVQKKTARNTPTQVKKRWCKLLRLTDGSIIKYKVGNGCERDFKTKGNQNSSWGQKIWGKGKRDEKNYTTGAGGLPKYSEHHKRRGKVVSQNEKKNEIKTELGDRGSTEGTEKNFHRENGCKQTKMKMDRENTKGEIGEKRGEAD